MKKIVSIFTLVCSISIVAWAQAPNAVNYQGVARDASGTPLANTTISMRLSIHNASSSGTVVYQETQTAQTNTFGLYNVAIGTGAPVSGSFGGINWASGNEYLQVEIDPTGGSNYTNLGAAQLLSAPYAIFANNSASTNALNGNSVSPVTPTSGQVLGWNGTTWTPTSVSGTGTVTSVTAGAGLSGGTITSSGTIGLPTEGTAGTYGSATQVPVITTDAYGRVTGVTNTPITGGGGVTSAGTTGYIPKFTSATAVGNSALYQNGSQLGLGVTTNTMATLHVQSATDTELGFFAATGAGETGAGAFRAESDGGAPGNYALVATTLSTVDNYGTSGILGAGNGVGVSGYATSSVAVENSYGVQGATQSDGAYSIGVAGFADGYQMGDENEIGVYGNSLNAVVPGFSNYAGYFDGDVFVNGSLSKSGGSFKIDDPLDPADKYLYHSFVESPDMMNIYNGNITTDANSEATVQLPEYFEAENKDFRYQLTVIGTFAQAIVYKEVANNTFVIKTSAPDVKVSWQVTGVRKDAWANAHRIVPEVEKEPFNKGKYLNAKELGKPASTQIAGLKPNKPSKKTLMAQSKASK